MNYYSHHIGDFNNATRHLTRVERALYRDAIELYYDTESVLTKDFEKLARRLLATSNEEKEVLKSILSEFFNETDDGYSHDRCEAEIAKYRTNTSNKAKAGIASALARQQKSTGVQQAFNEPITNNQEPITNINTGEQNQVPPTKKKTIGKSLPNDWVLPKAWGEWAKTEKPNFSNEQIRLIADIFKDHWLSNSNQANAKKSDWEAAWRNWIRKQTIPPPQQSSQPDWAKGML